MSVQRSEVRRMAHLARIKLGGGELDRLTGDLNRILEYVDALGTLDPAVAGETALPASELRSMRGEPRPVADRLSEGPGAFAPDWRDSFFVVPQPPGVHHRGGDE